MSSEPDAIIVGARCADASLGMLLARRGRRVLVLDRARFPSDTISTHFLCGSTRFDRLARRIGCPHADDAVAVADDLAHQRRFPHLGAGRAASTGSLSSTVR